VIDNIYHSTKALRANTVENELVAMDLETGLDACEFFENGKVAGIYVHGGVAFAAYDRVCVSGVNRCESRFPGAVVYSAEQASVEKERYGPVNGGLPDAFLAHGRRYFTDCPATRAVREEVQNFRAPRREWYPPPGQRPPYFVLLLR